eukprot:scaffold958_cov229-Ochromonas_danica.AAC.4
MEPTALLEFSVFQLVGPSDMKLYSKHLAKSSQEIFLTIAATRLVFTDSELQLPVKSKTEKRSFSIVRTV